MKSDQIYQALCDLAEKLGIEVSEQNFRVSGIRVSSGLCQIKGKTVYLMDKHKAISRKVTLLAEELSRHPHEDIFIVPVVRELLAKYAPKEVEAGEADPAAESNATEIDPR